VKTAVLFLLLLAAPPAPAETPSAAELLVKPELTERPADPSASPAPRRPPATPVPPPASTAEPAAEPAAEPEDDLVPPPFPLARYEALWKRSPFQLESVAPPVESAGLAQRYALTGLAEVGGEPIAFLMERSTQQRMMIKKGASEGGLTLVQVDVATDKYSNSTATIRQGAEVGVVKFDAGPPPMAVPGMAMPVPPPQIQPATPVAQAPGVPPQGQVPGMVGQVPGVPQSGIPAPAPAVPPGAVVGPNGQVQPPGQQPMPPPRVIRRRAIVPAAP
jgi:hypothetical protein